MCTVKSIVDLKIAMPWNNPITAQTEKQPIRIHIYQKNSLIHIYIPMEQSNNSTNRKTTYPYISEEQFYTYIYMFVLYIGWNWILP